ncbi:hypothetical protein N7513_010413 [Penicillium frequentans]|nr:hypothetical protein N7513_010413 [Penicillium glabrum]
MCDLTNATEILRCSNAGIPVLQRADRPMACARTCARWHQVQQKEDPLVSIYGLIGLHAVLAFCYFVLICAICDPHGVDAALFSNTESLKKSTERLIGDWSDRIDLAERLTRRFVLY